MTKTEVGYPEGGKKYKAAPESVGIDPRSDIISNEVAAESKIDKFVAKGIFTLRAVKDFVKAEATRSYSYAEAAEYAKRMF